MVALGVVAALQAWILFMPEPRLIVWSDSIGYLGPAVDAIERGEFTHWSGRGWGYPAFLWILLSASPAPDTVIAAQRLLVLATFGLLSAAMIVAGRALLLRGVNPRWLGAALVFWLCTWVLYPPNTGVAHIVMPEVLFSFVLALVLVGVTLQAFPLTSRHWLTTLTVVTVLASTALVVIKPHWAAAAVLVPLMLPALVVPAERRRTALTVLVAVVGAASVILVPEWRLQTAYDAHISRVFGPRSLFCNSADLVSGYLERQAADPLAAAVTPSLARILTPEARTSARDWWLIGFNGDACTYGEPARIVESWFGGDGSAEAAFYLATYSRALVEQPGYLVTRLSRHALELARRPFNSTGGDYFLRAESSVLERNRNVRRLFDRWLTERPDLLSGTIALPQRSTGPALRAFFLAAGWVLVLVVTAAVALGITAVWRGARPVALNAVLALVALALAVNGLIATVHTFEPRYLVMQTPLFSLLGYLSTLLTLERLATRVT
jgi:hypothetical protein